MTKYKDKNLNVPDEFKNIYKVLDKLEQRISTLEKVEKENNHVSK